MKVICKNQGNEIMVLLPRQMLQKIPVLLTQIIRGNFSLFLRI